MSPPGGWPQMYLACTSRRARVPASARWGAGRRRRLPGQVHRRYTAGISEDHGIGMVAAWSAAISRAARSG